MDPSKLGHKALAVNLGDLAGGGDYELLFTAPAPARASVMAALARAWIPGVHGRRTCPYFSLFDFCQRRAATL